MRKKLCKCRRILREAEVEERHLTDEIFQPSQNSAHKVRQRHGKDVVEQLECTHRAAHPTRSLAAAHHMPVSSEHPGKGDEHKGKIRRSDDEQAEKGYGRRGVPARPEVDAHVGEWGGEKWEIEEQ